MRALEMNVAGWGTALLLLVGACDSAGGGKQESLRCCVMLRLCQTCGCNDAEETIANSGNDTACADELQSNDDGCASLSEQEARAACVTDGTPEGASPACNDDQKLCDGECVSQQDPAFGCGAGEVGAWLCSPCDLSRATATCSPSGECAIDECDSGFADCNGLAADGCETDLQNDPEHCGACEAEPCADAFRFAEGECFEGECRIASCFENRKNCDEDPATGCEAQLLFDHENCGACDNSCGDGELCVDGQCQDCCTQVCQSKLVDAGPLIAPMCNPGG